MKPTVDLQFVETS